MKSKILFDTSRKHMVVRQCAFSNDEPDLHFVEIVFCSKDTRIVYFLLLRTHQLKMGSNKVKMRSIFGRKFHHEKSSSLKWPVIGKVTGVVQNKKKNGSFKDGKLAGPFI